MHRKSQTPNLYDDAVRLRDEVLRSGQPADPRHRLGADDDPNRIGQGTQGTVGAALTETLERVESLLGEVQTGRLTVPGKADTTMVYLHCRREHLHSVPSPLDWLPVW